jgi:hypothetical protein
MCHHAQGDEAKYRRADRTVATMHERENDALVKAKTAESEFDVAIARLLACKDYMRMNPETHNIDCNKLAELTQQVHRTLTKFHAASQYHLIQRAYYEGALRRQQELVTKNQQDLADIRELAGKLGS